MKIYTERYFKYRKTTDEEYCKTGKKYYVPSQRIRYIAYYIDTPAIKKILGFKFRTTISQPVYTTKKIPEIFTDSLIFHVSY